MRVPLSPLQVKNVFFETLKVEENPSGEKKDNLDIDFNYAKTESGDYAVEFELKYNLRAKNPLIRAHIKAIVVFSLDEKLPEDTAMKLLTINAPVITYGLIRGIIFQMCSFIPPYQRIIPAVNFLELIKSKQSKEK